MSRRDERDAWQIEHTLQLVHAERRITDLETTLEAVSSALRHLSEVLVSAGQVAAHHGHLIAETRAVLAKVLASPTTVGVA